MVLRISPVKSRNSPKIDLSPIAIVGVVFRRSMSLSTLEREVFRPKVKEAVVA